MLLLLSGIPATLSIKWVFQAGQAPSSNAVSLVLNSPTQILQWNPPTTFIFWKPAPVRTFPSKFNHLSVFPELSCFVNDPFKIPGIKLSPNLEADKKQQQYKRVSSRSSWWIGKPGVLQSMRLQSQTQLSNRTDLTDWLNTREEEICGLFPLPLLSFTSDQFKNLLYFSWKLEKLNLESNQWEKKGSELNINARLTILDNNFSQHRLRRPQ